MVEEGEVPQSEVLSKIARDVELFVDGWIEAVCECRVV